MEFPCFTSGYVPGAPTLRTAWLCWVKSPGRHRLIKPVPCEDKSIAWTLVYVFRPWLISVHPPPCSLGTEYGASSGRVHLRMWPFGDLGFKPPVVFLGLFCGVPLFYFRIRSGCPNLENCLVVLGKKSRATSLKYIYIIYMDTIGYC